MNDLDPQGAPIKYKVGVMDERGRPELIRELRNGKVQDWTINVDQILSVADKDDPNWTRFDKKVKEVLHEKFPHAGEMPLYSPPVELNAPWTYQWFQ